LNKACEDKEAEQGKEQQDGAEKSQVQLDLSTQAYKLFSDGKSPIEVSCCIKRKGIRDNPILQRVLEAKPNA
jgi:hypothetical protein